jgi:membrane protein implicated in regulation of membrane protease activity
LWRRFSRSVVASSDRPFLNRRAAGFVGRSYVLDQPIVDGIGRLRINDTLWKVRGPDAPAGCHIRVVAVEGATLIVAAKAD